MAVSRVAVGGMAWSGVALHLVVQQAVLHHNATHSCRPWRHHRTQDEPGGDEVGQRLWDVSSARRWEAGGGMARGGGFLMPIRPENRRHYPANWRTAIRPRILARAGHRCEGSLASPDCRAANHQPHPVTGSRVIFTVAHLDQTPEHWHPAHLRAWCQRCHLTYDAPHHAQTRRQKEQSSCTLALTLA